jgi:formylglycine-generating enzyme required for sulfatase activity
MKLRTSNRLGFLILAAIALGASPAAALAQQAGDLTKRPDLAAQRREAEERAAREAEEKKAVAARQRAAQAEARRKSAEAAITAIEQNMIELPGGSFVMGSADSEAGRDADEGPQRRVSISAFAVGKYEVTFAEWDACVADGSCNGYRPDDWGWGRGRRPVINVSFEDAKAYAAWVSAKTGKRYRLLTEAEWEYAARAGTTTAYPWGNTASHDYANYGKDECCGGLASGRDEWANETAPVGQFPANAFGLHDMHGNVWEWVEDCYESSYTGAPADGSAVTTVGCWDRVIRGGSWDNIPQFLRSAIRGRSMPANRSSILGFRLARTLP